MLLKKKCGQIPNMENAHLKSMKESTYHTSAPAKLVFPNFPPKSVVKVVKGESLQLLMIFFDVLIMIFVPTIELFLPEVI